MKKLLGAFVIALFVLEAIYVVGSALLLNSSTFISLLEMEDTTLTHVRVDGAWSPFPSLLRAPKVLVAVRDQNVAIDIRLNGVRFTFRPFRLFEKRFEVKRLDVDRVEVDVHLRDDRERESYIASHPDPNSGRIPSDEEIEVLRKRRWLVRIPNLDLHRVTPIAFDGKKVRGDIRIVGGFELRPGVEAEIFPTTVSATAASYENVLKNVGGTAVARFHRFSAPKTSGSEVFQYFDAETHLKGHAEKLDFVNLTLRSLNGFGFADGRTPFLADLFVRKGRLRPGSRFETPDDEFELKNSRFRFRGTGQIRWWIPRDDGTSHLSFHARRVDTRMELASLLARFEAFRVLSDAVIEGVDLKDPFQELTGNLRIVRGRFAIAAKTGFPWNAAGRIQGSIAGLTEGFDPEVTGTRPVDQRLSIRIDRGRLSLPIQDPDGRPLPISVRGDALLSGPAMILTDQATLPAAALDLRFTPEKGSKEKRLASRRSPSRLRLRLGGTRRTTDAFGEKKWGGAGRLRIENLSRVLDELEEAEVLSGTLRKVASTSSAETAFRWEKRQDYAILHADSIRSEGPWSATGAYSRAIDGKWLALLRGTYLGLPIGVAISPEGTSWKITSSERKKPSPAVTPVESPKPKRTRTSVPRP